MITFLARRLFISIVTLVIVTFIVFLMVHLAPGDPAVRAAGGVEASPEAIDAARERLGLNDSFITQYSDWMGGLVTGDMGTSLFSSASVADAIWTRLPVTLSLTLGATLVSLLIALPAGIIAAVRSGSWVDRAVTAAASLGIAAPNFFIGLLLIEFLAVDLGWFPAIGYTSPSESFTGWVHGLTLPSITLGVAVAAEVARHLRASLRDILHQDYVRTATAKGLPPTRVIGKHAMKNAAVPVATVLGLQVRRLLGGTIVVESIFDIPGLGSLAVSAVFGRDLPMIQGIAVATVVIVVLVNLAVDILYLYLNPKMRPS